MVAVILPDGGRSYLSKVFNDAWMRQYGFLEREEELTVGDVLRRKHAEGEIPPLLTVETHAKVRDAVALLHEHRVSQLPVVSAHDPQTVVGSVSERGLLRHAMDDPALLSAEIVEVMEAPFPAVSDGDAVREAVELLADRREGAARDHGRPRGRDPDASGPARVAGPVSDRRIETRVVHAGLDPDPTYGSVIPPIHQTSTYVQPSPGEFVEDYDYARSANPTRAALERAIGELEGGLGSAFSSGMAATHALITARCSAGDHVVLPSDLYGGYLPARRQGAEALRPRVRHGRPDRSRRPSRRRSRPETRLIWVETPPNPLLNVVGTWPRVVGASRERSLPRGNTFATPIRAAPRSSLAPTRGCTRRRSTWAATRTWSAAPSWCGDPRLHERPLRPERDRRRAGPFDCFLVHRGLRHASPARGRRTPRTGRAVSEFLPARRAWRTCAGRASAGWSRSATRRDPDRRRPTEIFTCRVARRRGVADRGAPGDDPPSPWRTPTAAVPPDLIRLSCGVRRRRT
jgi:cystathionine gamma-synthase